MLNQTSYFLGMPNWFWLLVIILTALAWGIRQEIRRK